MKKFLLCVFIIFSMLLNLPAQDGDPAKRAEKVQALKIAFISQKLDLTSAEAENFWPVYGQYEKDVKQLFGDRKSDNVIENEEQLLNIRKKYRPQFEKVLGKPRMNKLFSTEKEFRGVLIQQLKKKSSNTSSGSGPQQRGNPRKRP
ncbi:MAG: hypothetical protein ABIR81_11305 [Ginsengibacter sp.]